MRTRLRGKVTLLFMTCAVLLAIPAMALADTLQINNTLVVGSNVSKDPGQSGTGKVWLDPSDNSTDPQNGCNATDPAPVTVTFTSSDTSKIANPAPVTLTECGPNKAQDFSYNVSPSATAGTVQIKGSVSGGRGGTYNTNDTLTVTINAPAKQNTSISNVSGSGTYGGNSTLTAKLSSGANNLSGKNVSFELNGQAVGTDATDANGVAELSGVSLSGINAGTYNNAVSANFVGDSAYDGSSGSGNLSVAKANPTIDVKGYTGVYDGDAHGASGTATGVNGEDLSGLLDLGDKFIDVPGGTAHWSFDGGTNYNDANGTARIDISKAPSTTTVTCTSGPFTYNGQSHTPCTVSVTGAGGLNQSPTPDYSDNVNAGTAMASYTYAGDANHEGSSDSKTFTIDKAVQAITFAQPADKIVGAPDFDVSATGGDSGNPVTFAATPGGTCTISGSTVHITGVGTCTITASQAGNANYLAAPDVSQRFNVTYKFGGFLQPINWTAHQVMDTNVSTFKLGSTVPVKFRLTDANGNAVQAGSAQWLPPQKLISTTQAVDESVYSDPATAGNLYKWDPTAQQSIYNWSTKGMSSGYYYKIGVKVDDGQTYYTYISLR